MKKYSLALFIIIAFINLKAVAQDNQLSPDNAFRAQIVGKGKAYADKIALRWNVDNYQIFEKLVKEGVLIDRLTIDANNKAEGSWKRIVTDTIKAKPLAAFGNKNSTNDTAKMVVAQMLYGKSNYPQNTNLLEKIKVQQEEKQNKHLITSLYSAISAEAAMLAGLGFEDKFMPDTSKKYVYRVYNPGKSKMVGRLDTGYIYVIGRDLKVTEKFLGLKTEQSEGIVSLKWPKETSPFSGYYIERSTDKKNFKRVNKNIYLPLIDTAASSKFLYYADSVANYTKYYYRLKGVNAFGEIKLFNDTVMGMGVDQTPPQVVQLSFDRKVDEVTFNWTPNKQKDFKGYFLVKGNGIANADSVLNNIIFPTNQSTYKINLKSDFSSAYYRLLLTDTVGNVSYSNAVFIFNADTVPPKAPVGLAGKIDSLGNIKLNWQTDPKEPALRGYKVFIANQIDHEFTAVSGIVADTTFNFSTTLKTLSKNLYVKLVAVDANFNHSKFSKAYLIKRPDTIAPPRPIMTDYVNNNKGITVNWTQDKSNDFLQYKLYKRVAGEKNWNILLNTRLTTFTDSLVTGGKSYEYTAETIDSAGLSSGYAMPVHIRTSFLAKNVNLVLKAAFDQSQNKLTLNWNNPSNEIDFFILYKDNGQGLTMHKSFPKTQLSFIDDVEKFAESNYAMKIVYADKTESDLFKIKP